MENFIKLTKKRNKLFIRALKNRLNNRGWVYSKEINELAKRYGIPGTTLYNILSKMKNIQAIKYLYSGDNAYIESLGLKNTIVNGVIKFYRKPEYKSTNIWMMAYDATLDKDYRLMISILNRKDYFEDVTFPPQVGSYIVVIHGDKRYIFWSEESIEEEEAYLYEEEKDSGGYEWNRRMVLQYLPVAPAQ